MKGPVFTFWFVLGIAFATLGLLLILQDYRSDEMPSFQYSSLFVVSASMFAMHIFQNNFNAGERLRAESVSVAIVGEIVELSEKVSVELCSLEIPGINLRYRNAARMLHYISDMCNDDRLSDFDRQRARFYQENMHESLRAFLQSLHPCFFYGDIYVAATGNKYAREDFEQRLGFFDLVDHPEIAMCEIKLEGLIEKSDLAGFEFLYYSNGYEVNEFVGAGTLRSYCASFKGVWSQPKLEWDE